VQEFAPDMPLDTVIFDYVNKEEMIMKTKGAMERGEVWLQMDDIALQGQIRNIARKITESGRITYHGKPHDDMFWAMALAIKAGTFTEFAMYSIGGRMQFGR
jgi:phage FluMu gp28-like protein